jgi:quercetin dioxygenase-like cupin family protein
MDDAGTRASMVIPPGSGRLFWVLTDWIQLKIGGQETGGALSIVEQKTVPQARPPLHRHTFDEVHYVLEGEYEYYLEGDEPGRATVGTIVFVPSGIAHTYRNIGSTPGRILAIYSPPGFEDFYPVLDMPVADTSTPPVPTAPIDLPGIERLLMEQYGTELLEPLV